MTRPSSHVIQAQRKVAIEFERHKWKIAKVGERE
jgi:hypothetical protein